MKKLLCVLAIAVLANSYASAKLPDGGLHGNDKQGQENLKVDKTKIIGGLEQQLGRDLTQEERDAAVAFSATASAMADQLFPKYASIDSNQSDDVTTLLLCLGAKGALILKFGTTVCVDSAGNGRLLVIAGTGLSVGLAGTATVFMHRGHIGSLPGSYSGATVGANTDGFKALVSRFIGAVVPAGPEILAFQNEKNGSMLVGAGLIIGKMLDLSLTGILIQ